MLVTITQTFHDGTRLWQAGETIDVPKEVATRMIADAVAEADTDGLDQAALSGNMVVTQVKRAGAPAVADGGAGNLNGTYYWRVTFVTADGETEAGPYVGPTALSSRQAALTSIPLGPPGVTSRRIFRSTGSGSQYDVRLVATIADNTTTTYTDNVADGSLGAQAPHANTTGGVFKYRLTGSGGYTGPGIQIDETTTTLGIGTNPLQQGYNLTAIGVVALANNTTGYNNTAIGNVALNANTSANHNTGVGYAALGGISNSGASSNTAVGVSAGGNTSYSSQGVYIGHSAFTGSSSSNYAGNVSIGYESYGSLGANVLSYNVAVGYRAARLAWSANANYNVIIGPEAGSSASASPAQATNVSSSVAIGRLAATTRSRQVALGSPDATNGITETQLQGQVRISYQDATLAAPNAAAALQIDSTTRGVLLPRMTTAERDAISSPPAGLLIYNTSTNKLNFRAAAAWEAVTSV